MSEAASLTVDSPAKLGNMRRRLLIMLAAVVVVGGIGWWFWYNTVHGGRVETENAYVGADSAQVTPLVAGAVVEVRAGNTQSVKAGDVLIILDDADARVDMAVAEAALMQAEQRFAQSRARGSALSAQVSARGADIAQANARLAAAAASLDRANLALRRREALAGSGAVSGEELSNARAEAVRAGADMAAARATLSQTAANRASANGELAVNQAVTRGLTIATDPDIAAARARVAAAKLALDRTVIRAPISGIVTARQVQPGQRVAPGAPVMLIVPVETAFVDANFKESQLKAVRPGQKVELTADIYGSDIRYHGVVKGLAGGTGAAFSLIPAQNATGNWVKVIQRLPVRITLDPAELRAHPLRVGMSMTAVIDTRAP
ncbi:MAG: HlyD family efflux transporter periplasmic adaptor subunit [Sphingomonadaceae bacterium]